MAKIGLRFDSARKQLAKALQVKSIWSTIAIHSEKGGPARSVAVIVRSERLVGRVLQGRYDPKTNKYYESEGPTQVPFEMG